MPLIFAFSYHRINYPPTPLLGGWFMSRFQAMRLAFVGFPLPWKFMWKWTIATGSCTSPKLYLERNHAKPWQFDAKPWRFGPEQTCETFYIHLSTTNILLARRGMHDYALQETCVYKAAAYNLYINVYAWLQSEASRAKRKWSSFSTVWGEDTGATEVVLIRPTQGSLLRLWTKDALEKDLRRGSDMLRQVGFENVRSIFVIWWARSCQLWVFDSVLSTDFDCWPYVLPEVMSAGDSPNIWCGDVFEPSFFGARSNFEANGPGWMKVRMSMNELSMPKWAVTSTSLWQCRQLNLSKSASKSPHETLCVQWSRGLV